MLTIYVHFLSDTLPNIQQYNTQHIKRKRSLSSSSFVSFWSAHLFFSSLITAAHSCAGVSSSASSSCPLMTYFERNMYKTQRDFANFGVVIWCFISLRPQQMRCDYSLKLFVCAGRESVDMASSPLWVLCLPSTWTAQIALHLQQHFEQPMSHREYNVVYDLRSFEELSLKLS